jgi:hypothetical protein
MQHSPSSEANPFSASQEIPRILRNPKFHNRIRKSSPPVPVLNHIDPVHASPSHLLKVHFNIILPPTLRSSKWSLSIRYPPDPLCKSLIPPYVLHDPPITPFSIWLPESLFGSRPTDSKPPHYVLFSTPLLPRPSYAQIFYLAPYSQTPSAYIPPIISLHNINL